MLFNMDLMFIHIPKAAGSYYTAELEEIAYNKYRWVLDNGICDRMICPG